jgi:hypothetical protein
MVQTNIRPRTFDAPLATQSFGLHHAVETPPSSEKKLIDLGMNSKLKEESTRSCHHNAQREDSLFLLSAIRLAD